MRSNKLIIIIVFLLFTSTAFADDTCTIRVNKLNFGEYSSIAAAHTDVDTTIELDCPPAITALVKIDAGENAQGEINFHQRNLRSSKGYYLKYNLYIDATRSRVWGDGTNNSYTATIRAGQSQLTIYGRIPARQNIPQGYYTDRVSVTIEW